MSAYRQDNARTLVPHQVVGGCRILRGIGRGGMGEVYLAQHLALQKHVALKILPPDFDRPEHVDRFLNEARTCARIEHPNVVPVYDVGKDKGSGVYYLVMQYVEGKNLAELVHEQGRPLPCGVALRVVRFAARGLDAVHRHGVVHRDIKPSNIMLSTESRVLLMDFGLVRDESGSHMTRTGAIMGTFGYMSPEQCLGKLVGPRSDIYSLGASLYWLLTGSIPFRGSTNEIIAQMAMEEPPKPIAQINPSVPLTVIQLVEKAMAYQPQGRFRDAKTMVRALGEILKETTLLSDEKTASAALTNLATATVPELEPIEVVPIESKWLRVRRWLPWIGAGAAIPVLLTLTAVINLLARPSAPNHRPNMVYVEAGRVQLGNDQEKVFAYLKEMNRGLSAPQLAAIRNWLDAYLEPVSHVYVARFWIDRYEVTNAQYAQFLKATNWPAPSGWSSHDPPFSKEDHPVVNIRYEDAAAYARWAGKKLPTSAQWTRAFRGDKASLFPWGDQYDARRANVADSGEGTTIPVQATPEDVTEFGVYNLVGNVQEFLRDKMTDPGKPVRRVIKGASYRSTGYDVGIAGIRVPCAAQGKWDDTGFRCVVETL